MGVCVRTTALPRVWHIMIQRVHKTSIGLPQTLTQIHKKKKYFRPQVIKSKKKKKK
jgi:hypothetical protein